LLAWFKDSGDTSVRSAMERLITGLLHSCTRDGLQLIQPGAKLEQSSGSHLAGYQIWPVIRFFEMTGYRDALTLAEGLTQWVMHDPVLDADGTITLALSWEGHIHSWLDTLAGCARTAKHSPLLTDAGVMRGCRAVYDWVMRTNATRFGWIATFPGHGSCETCAISSAIRLALELGKFDDVERFVRNQVIEAQFRDLSCYADGPEPVTPLLLGCFDSQSLPNGHLGTQGGEDVGNVEGCCLNGGMRAIALAWEAAHSGDGKSTSVNLLIEAESEAVKVIDHQPDSGKIEIIPRYSTALKIRVPPWLTPHDARVTVNDQPVSWHIDDGYFSIALVPSQARVMLEFPLPEFEEVVSAGGETYRVRWRGDTVVAVDPPGRREPTYRDR
jgi:hypothetical protein